MAIRPTGTVSEETTELIVVAMQRQKKNTKQQMIVLFVVLLNEETATNAIMEAVVTILNQFEPLNQLMDEFFLDELVQCWGLCTLKFVPKHIDTICSM